MEEGRHSSPIDPVIGRRGRFAGIALVSAGLLVLAGVATYFGYASYAVSQLDELTFSAEEYVASSFNGAGRQGPLVEPASRGSEVGIDRSAGSDANPDAVDSAGGLLRYAAAYPGVQLHPKYWHEPLRAGTDTRQAQGLPDGFRAVAGAEELRYGGDFPLAHRIQIPMLRLDSGISDLAILDLGDSRAYETPKNTVGHIPSTSNPGERGNAWFFGHLESPIKGEGNVFHRLPEIPELLRNYVETGDDPVYIMLTSADGEYLYVVTATQVVYQDDLSLYGSDDASVTLVVCVPRLVYDHRLLVTAKLVGIKG